MKQILWRRMVKAGIIMAGCLNFSSVFGLGTLAAQFQSSTRMTSNQLVHFTVTALEGQQIENKVYSVKNCLLQVNETDCKGFSELTEEEQADGSNFSVFGSDQLTRDQIISIEFVNTQNIPEECNKEDVFVWDVSKRQTGTIMAYAVPEETEESRYKLYIASEKPVKLSVNDDHIFSSFTNVESIEFNDMFDVSEISSLRCMFYNCSNLDELNLENFETSNVTDMSYMFYGCSGMSEIDLSKFVISASLASEAVFDGTEWEGQQVEAKEYTKTAAIQERIIPARSENISYLIQSKTVDSSNWDDLVEDERTDGKNFSVFGFEALNRDEIKSIDFVSVNDLPEECYEENVISWDVSEEQNRTILAYAIQDDTDSTKYKLYIASYNVIKLCEDATRTFASFTSVENISFNGMLDTSDVTSMYELFLCCSALQYVDLEDFNTESVTNMSYMFYGCSNLHDLDLKSFKTSDVTNMKSMFSKCSDLETISINKSNFRTNSVSDMSHMFYNCYALTNLDLIGFNTVNTKNMSFMFSGCENIDNLDLSNFSTGSVEDMSGMFMDCYSLETLDLSGFNTSSVTNMEKMFCDCENLSNIIFSSGFRTDNVTSMYAMFCHCMTLESLELEVFNTSQVNNMQQMFSGCSSLKSLDLHSFNTENVTNMSYMFYACYSLNSLDIGSFNTEKVTDMNMMFHECKKLSELNVSSFRTENVTNMEEMFCTCESLQKLDLTNFDTAKVTTMKNMFKNCINLSDLDLSSFSFDSLDNENKNCFSGSYWEGAELEAKHYGFLSESSALIEMKSTDFEGIDNIEDVSADAIPVFGNTDYHRDQIKAITFVNSLDSQTEDSWDVSADQNGSIKAWVNQNGELYDLYIGSNGKIKIVDGYRLFELFTNVEKIEFSDVIDSSELMSMAAMFENCSSLSEINISSFNSDELLYTFSMFKYCSELKTIVGLNALDTKNVINMSGMFKDCTSLEELDLSAFNTESVTTMSVMFKGCSSLTELDISSFDTPSLTDISFMFDGCASLNHLIMNMDTFSTANVTTMVAVFQGCGSLTELDLSNFDTSKVTDMGYMFYDCFNLNELLLDADNFNTAQLTRMEAMFYNCCKLQKIPTEDFNTSNVTNMKWCFTKCSNLVELDLTSFEFKTEVDTGGIFNGTPWEDQTLEAKLYTQLSADEACAQGETYYRNDPPDYTQALKYYRDAAEKGSYKAMRRIAYFYQKGYGVDQDYDIAYDWNIKAAEGKDPVAMHQLGWFYQNGYGKLEQDYDTALEWYHKAADEGQGSSMSQIAYFYANGYGEPGQDYEKAIEWYEKAIDAGYEKEACEEAIDNLKNLINNGTTEESEGSVYTDTATITSVQNALNAAGYDCGTADGKLGSKTIAALHEFQNAKGLTVTDDITDELLEALELK